MLGRASTPPCIYVLAGTNGAGKSSIGGAAVRDAGGTYYNPDEITRSIQRAHPEIALEQANSLAWKEGVRLLAHAIRYRETFAFETTLGGDTITQMLIRAARKGLEVRIWYVGLRSPDLHVRRVRERVAQKGHAIPEAAIRERYVRSRENLIRLLPHLTELHVFDNSKDVDLAAGVAPEPKFILHVRQGLVVDACARESLPRWAMPIVQAAFRLSEGG